MRIAVYGASGRLGRSVVRRLHELGVDVLAIARRVESLSSELEPGKIQIAEAASPEALVPLLAGSSVLVHCASAPGDRVVAAALAARVGYLDAAGDQGWIRHVYETLAPRAAEAGILLAPAHGVDYALGDVLARLALREVEPAEELLLAYAPRGAGVAAGSARFASEIPGAPEVEYRAGQWCQARWSGWQRFEFPAPLGARRVTRYGSGEVLTVPRHSKVDTVVSYIVSSALAPHPALEVLLPLLRPVAARLRRSPLRGLLAGAARLASRRSSEPESEPDGGELTLVARARGRDGAESSWVVEGEGFRPLSAELLARGAIRVAESANREGGACSAAQLFEPEELLAGVGVAWRRLQTT